MVSPRASAYAQWEKAVFKSGFLRGVMRTAL
jgi:hypothetical protein